MRLRNKLLATVAAVAIGSAPMVANAMELTMFHNWSNDAEISALNAIFTSLEKESGHTIKAASVPHETAGEAPLVSLIMAGAAPNIFLSGDSNTYRDLAARGLGQEVGALFDRIGATAAFPKVVQQAITVDGKVVKIPTAVHIDGMVYFNKEVAETAGVDPSKWTSLADMWADQAKVEDAGFTFIAIGGNSFQAGYTFHALLAANAGPDVYNRFYGVQDGEADKSVLDDPALLDTIKLFRKIVAQTDDGWVNRAWNDTTNTVITGKALMQIHGDWMKGVWKGAGKEAGTDFGCINIPGTKALAVTVDAFGILGGVSPDVLEAEEAFASAVVDPAVNAEFAFHKGSTPVRTDVPTDRLDECNTVVLESLQKDDLSVENPWYISDTDWINSVWNVIFAAMGDTTMTDEEVVQQLKDEHDAVFG